MEGSPPVRGEVRPHVGGCGGRLRRLWRRQAVRAHGEASMKTAGCGRGEDRERETPPHTAVHCVNAGAGNGCGEERRRGR